MLKKLAIATLAVLFLAPSLILVGIGVVMNPALTATGACVVPGGTNLTVGDVPDELEVTTANGETFTLNRTQLTHAATIITVGARTAGVGSQADSSFSNSLDTRSADSRSTPADRRSQAARPAAPEAVSPASADDKDGSGSSRRRRGRRGGRRTGEERVRDPYVWFRPRLENRDDPYAWTDPHAPRPSAASEASDEAEPIEADAECGVPEVANGLVCMNTASRGAATPLRRMGRADEIAGTAAWLISPAGGFVTGQAIVVDGGTVVRGGL